jgi:peroxiredoxin
MRIFAKQLWRRLRGLGKKEQRMMLKIGDTAPAFTVQTHEGKDLSLTNLRGKKVLLWFYPKADTPG